VRAPIAGDPAYPVARYGLALVDLRSERVEAEIELDLDLDLRERLRPRRKPGAHVARCGGAKAGAL
jgi:hypothetical protein